MGKPVKEFVADVVIPENDIKEGEKIVGLGICVRDKNLKMTFTINVCSRELSNDTVGWEFEGILCLVRNVKSAELKQLTVIRDCTLAIDTLNGKIKCQE